VRVLVACEFSGTVRDAFAARGHDAWSCDILPTERPGQHIQGDVRACLERGRAMADEKEAVEIESNLKRAMTSHGPGICQCGGSETE